MEVDDLELLELVNDYQRRSDEANYIEDEINDYMMIEDISISKLAK